MKILNSKEINVYKEDDFLYSQLQRLFNEIKITQGGSSLDATLRRHQKLRNYAIAKQISYIKSIEERYFNEDGSVNLLAINSHNSSLQK